ncbi:MAG: ABC transporter substrate-binding protein [Chloroflexi bacterium]|nr:MAG: ABC transporter substrate-binding protein [Chloroflexota bacterium]
MKWRLLLIFVCLITGLVYAQDDATNLLDTCVQTYDPDQDYFPDKVEVEYSTGFSVEYFNNYKLLSVVTPWEETVQYILLQCGTPAPQGYDDIPVIEVPVQRVVTTSTTFLPHFVDQDVVETIVGMDNLSFPSEAEIVDWIETGNVVEVYADYAPNTEVLIELDPDVVFLQDFAPDGAAVQLAELGIPTALNYDFNDTTPLGQAEWGKYFALFFNTEAAANEQFEAVETAYLELAALTTDLQDRPTVMVGSPWQGTWYVSGGGSYPAALLKDAGADYLWADTEESGSLALEFETVLDVAAQADFWVNVNWTTLDDALAENENYDEFAPFRNGQVYAYNAAVGPNGGILYFETGAAYPHLVLADLIAIFHPDLLPDHELYFYRAVPQSE